MDSTDIQKYSPIYEVLESEAEEDLRRLAELVDSAVESERSMTSSSLPKGFEGELIESDNFGFEASKIYDSGTEISVRYDERDSISFNRPDSSSVEINVELSYSITDHWDQRM